MRDVRGLVSMQERCYAAELAELSDDTEPWCGGLMISTYPGSWCNLSLARWGYGDVDATREDIDALRDFFESRGIEPRVSVTAYASPTSLGVLRDAGFRLLEVEHVLCASPGDVVPRPAPSGVDVERFTPDDPREVDAVAATLSEGFSGRVPEPGTLGPVRRPILSDAVHVYTARVGGEYVGVSGLRVFEDVGYLSFASTLERHRGRGVHSGLIAARIARAMELGLSWLTVTSVAGGGTERNALRYGFRPLYARLTMTRPGEGLTPNPM